MKIICIGRNYIDHAKELNNPVPENPVFFLKPDTALLRRNKAFYYPDFSDDIHYECELVVKINKLGKNIQKKFAHTYYDEIGIGIDFTARDLQSKAKKKGLPWEIAKAFDASAPLSLDFISKSEYKDIHSIPFHLNLNGETVQEGSSADMIFNIDDLIVYLSKFFTLKTGDLIFTGTPAGVGPVKIGDKLEAYIGDRLMLKCSIK
ncbi:MAG: 2-hydroxyhepta-2,4-diene-1,7-dioate isomerase [Bacteroidetes bacterium]|nr:MAG: 2-hydroxyhepta-2,4-diene-1,7-dioate isomerase [Bacteroidota bacterium]